MIAFVQGKIAYIENNALIIDTGSIGYEVFVSNPDEFLAGTTVLLYTYQQIREDANELYGFLQRDQLELFKRLIQVKGIGVKTALQAFRVLGAKELVNAIEQEDLNTLKKLPGIGNKSASQIILDLKGKIRLEESISPIWNSAKEALKALGYKNQELSGLEKEIDLSADLNSVIKAALQKLAARKGFNE